MSELSDSYIGAIIAVARDKPSNKINNHSDPNNVGATLAVARKEIPQSYNKQTCKNNVGATLAVARQKPETAQKRSEAVKKRAGASPAPTIKV